MRILVVSPHYYPENFSITNICEDLAKRGHEVFVLTGQPCYGKETIYPGYEKTGKDLRNGVTIFRVKVHPRKQGLLSLLQNYFSFWENSRHFVKKTKEKFDVVFSICLSPILAVDSANKFAKTHHVPHIHFCLDLWPASVVAVTKIKENSLFYHLLFNISKSIYSKMDEIIVSSPSFLFYFSNVLHLEKQKIIYIPQPSIVSSKIRKNIALGPLPNFIYAGNIGTIQEVDKLILACAPFKNDPKFSLHILGAGSRLEFILDLIKKEGLSSFVKYEGVVPAEEVGDWLSSSDALIVSLKQDAGIVSSTIPNKLTTYLSYGKPLIANISGDGLDVCEKTGGCITGGPDVNSISAAYSKFLLLDAQKREEMGEKNQEFFRLRFSFKNILDSIEKELINSSDLRK